MPAARFKEDFENWIKSYESQGNKVYINNRIYLICTQNPGHIFIS